MKFRIIGTIVVIVILFVMYVIFNGGSEQQAPSGSSPEVMFPQ